MFTANIADFWAMAEIRRYRTSVGNATHREPIGRLIASVLRDSRYSRSVMHALSGDCVILRERHGERGKNKQAGG